MEHELTTTGPTQEARLPLEPDVRTGREVLACI